MQPRGQLWFELQRVCQDFRDFSGLSPRESGQVLVAVLSNLLADQQAELAKATAGETPARHDTAGKPAG